jgi:hypothetical protein
MQKQTLYMTRWWVLHVWTIQRKCKEAKTIKLNTKICDETERLLLKLPIRTVLVQASLKVHWAGSCNDRKYEWQSEGFVPTNRMPVNWGRKLEVIKSNDSRELVLSSLPAVLRYYMMNSGKGTSWHSQESSLEAKSAHKLTKHSKWQTPNIEEAVWLFIVVEQPTVNTQ